MTPTFVQGAANNASGVSTLAKAFTSNVVAGHLLVIDVSAIVSLPSGWSVTDSQGNTYTQVVTAGSTPIPNSSQIWMAIAGSSGANTVTFHLGAAESGVRMLLHEYSGADTFDVGTSASGNTNLLTATTAATSHAVELIHAYGVSNNGVTAAGTGFTLRQTASSESSEDANSSSTGAQTATFGQAAVNQWIIVVATFYASAGGGTTLSPSGLTRTRAQGSLGVSPQAKPSGQAHTRAQGALVVVTAGTIVVAGLVRTRGQGSLSVSGGAGTAAGYPSTSLYPSANLYPGIGVVVARQLGALIVTVAGRPRPVGLVRARGLGALVVIGRDLQPLGQAHLRAQGRPTLSARALLPGLAHARGSSSPSVAPAALAPAGLAHTRGAGAHVVTLVKIGRPAGAAHTRVLGAPTAHGRATITTAALAHARAQGNPTLSARALPAGLAHTRAQGLPSVNTRTLAPLALSRA